MNQKALCGVKSNYHSRMTNAIPVQGSLGLVGVGHLLS